MLLDPSASLAWKDTLVPKRSVMVKIFRVLVAEQAEAHARVDPGDAR